MTVILAWVLLWRELTIQPVLQSDAENVINVTAAFWAASVLWWALVRSEVVRITPRLNVLGIVVNLIIISAQTKVAFTLLIMLNAVLPLISIAVNALYGKRAFRISLFATFVILMVTAPPGFWISRTAYAVYAIGLTIGLPLMVARLINALRDATIESVLARDAQRRFVSAMSHELRTPLNSLTNCAVLIETRNMDEDQRSLVDAVTQSANALLHRVNDVLDVAGIESGRMNPRVESFQLRQVVQMVKAVCQLPADEKGVKFRILEHDAGKLTLVTDGGRLEQAITNLVTNAIKFTPPGGSVTLEVNHRRDNEQGRCHLRVRVIDTGVGIPESKREEIFRPFHQVDNGPSRRSDGVGLGLFIVKSIVDMLEGRIQVSANPGGGTIFEMQFELPMASEAGGVMNHLDNQALLKHHFELMPRLRCSVFEDIHSNRLVLIRMLELAGHEVVMHTLGNDALIPVVNSDLVLLDLNMPGLSGYDVLAQMEEHALQTPVLILTADASASMTEFAHYPFVKGIVIKPITFALLLEGIAAAVPLNVPSRVQAPTPPDDEPVALSLTA
jgi:two-component system sensor histidine kinase RpfC